MKKIFLLIMVLFLFQNICAQDYYYHEVTADKKADLYYKNYWNEKNEVKGFYFFSPISGQSHEVFLDQNFATLKWINTKPDGFVDIYTRDGNQIIAEVIRDGKNKTVKRDIDSAPWYASMEFGLGQFFRKGEQTVEFWNILPDNLKSYKMKAEILSKEVLQVVGVPTNTIKVRVTINGIPALFFHFMYWFRESDGFFVRFEGAKGIPGTPLTTMEFLKIE